MNHLKQISKYKKTLLMPQNYLFKLQTSSYCCVLAQYLLVIYAQDSYDSVLPINNNLTEEKPQDTLLQLNNSWTTPKTDINPCIPENLNNKNCPYANTFIPSLSIMTPTLKI